MSDPENRGISREDEQLLDDLDSLGPESSRIDVDTLEALGSMPYELSEIEPRPEVKRALMAGAGLTAPDSSPETVGQSSRLTRLERRTRWYMPMAAVLAIALVGLTVWQFRQMEGQRRTIAAMSDQLETLRQDGDELALARLRLDEMQSRIKMLTASGSEFCVLKPYGSEPTFPKATATMVISSDRNRWFLAAEGLEPCAQGRSYQLWFITDEAPIRAAVFDGKASGGRVELSGIHEGVPTGVRAITVTLETESEPVEPSAPILFADQAMTLL